MNKERIQSCIGIITIISLFVLFSYLIQSNLTFFRQHIDLGLSGMLLFILIVALSIIFAPISSVPLFPLGSNIWGWFITGILGTIGWTLGAIIAFLLARKYGIALVKKVLPLKKIYYVEQKIPQEHIFLTLVFLRMVIPIDGISYLMGLFSKMSLKTYTLATLLGLIPFTFMIAYLGIVPFYYQIIFVSIAFLVVLVGFILRLNKK